MNGIRIGWLLVAVFVVTSACLGTADDALDKAIQKDRQQIAGTWRIVALEVNGNKAKDEDARKLTVVNGTDGNWSLVSEGKEVAKGTSTFDPTKTPKTIDFNLTDADGNIKHHQGIYELGATARKMCFAQPDKSRPSDFSSTAENEQILVSFERR